MSISWASSDTGIIGTTGAVTRPDDMTTDVVLTATLSKGAAADQTKTFTLTVLISDAGTVKLAKDNLMITYGGTDDASDVTQDVTLSHVGNGRREYFLDVHPHEHHKHGRHGESARRYRYRGYPHRNPQ